LRIISDVRKRQMTRRRKRKNIDVKEIYEFIENHQPCKEEEDDAKEEEEEDGCEGSLRVH
jgi:hypothetical protein